MASNPLFITLDFFCIFLMNFAMATLTLYEMEKLRRNYEQEPCTEMSSIVFKAETLASENESLRFIFKHPVKAKVIKQIKSVDLHALIGNIGGYIGLFLGTLVNSVSVSVKRWDLT